MSIKRRVFSFPLSHAPHYRPSSWWVTSGVALSLMMVSPLGLALVTASGDTSLTYTYNAATLDSDVELVFSSDWHSADGHYAPWACYRASALQPELRTNVNGIGYTMNYALDLRNSQASVEYRNVLQNTWYNNSGPPGSSGGKGPIPTQVTVRVAGGQATGKPAGTYSLGTLSFRIDMQENLGSGCEGSTSSLGSGEVTYSAFFVIPGMCQVVSTSTVDFGLLQSGLLATHQEAMGGVTVNCNQALDYTVYLGDGQNAKNGSTGRRMKNGTVYLPYQLYKDAARTQVWDNTGAPAVGGNGGVQRTGNASDQTLQVYGRIPAGTLVPGKTGTYSDTVIVTVAY